MHRNHAVTAVSVFLAAAAGISCSKTASENATATGGRPPAGAPVAGPGGAAGARGAQALTIAPTDVSIARTSTIIDGIPITGNLRPIETVSVRARLEGDLEGIYVREGDRVRAGQLLARFESTEQQSGVQSSAADKAAAEGDLATTEWNLKQSEDLFKAGAIAEGELRVARNSVGTARARLAAANSRLRTSSSSNRDTRVLAPTSGTVEKRMVESGEHIARGAEMFSVVRNDVLELTAAVPEKAANAVAPGQTVQFVANGRTFSGRVARVSPTVDPLSRAVFVYVQVPNSNGQLKGGTFASGTVQARTIANAIIVPTSAVKQTAAGKPLVYRIENGVLDTAGVVVGVSDERAGIVELVSGVSAGDSIISGNVGSMGKGMKVQIITANGGRERGGAASGAPATRQP